MFERRVNAGDYIIRQGDDGDNFYVVDRFVVLSVVVVVVVVVVVDNVVVIDRFVDVAAVLADAIVSNLLVPETTRTF